jgi:hypothetical protein
MDADGVRLECLKIAAQEVEGKLRSPETLVGRAAELSRFVIDGANSASRVHADSEPH